MKKTTYKAVFNRKKKLNKNGTAIIQIECYLNGKRKYISTGIRIEPIYWNNKFNIVKNNHPEHIELNRLINQQIREIEDFEFKQLEKNSSFSLTEITKFNIGNNINHDSFLDFCKENLFGNKAVSGETIRHHRVTIKKLEDFYPEMTFNDINYNLIKQFDDYLRDKKLHINTIANQHKVFKVYINLAIKKNLLSADAYPYKSFKVKKVQTKRDFLTMQEIEQISNVQFTETTKHIEYVRDMFVFSCYAGLRFADMQGLRNKDIKKVKGEYVIEIRMNKTQDYIKLPVSLLFDGKAVDIIQKYEENFPEKFLFPRISNQKANLKLKVVALLADINKNLTFHISRHTFGTNLASATSDQFLIRELMGHSDIKTSMIYIHTSQEQIRNKLKNTKWE